MIKCKQMHGLPLHATPYTTHMSAGRAPKLELQVSRLLLIVAVHKNMLHLYTCFTVRSVIDTDFSFDLSHTHLIDNV